MTPTFTSSFSRLVFISFCLFFSLTVSAQDADGDGVPDGVDCQVTTSELSLNGSYQSQNPSLVAFTNESTTNTNGRISVSQTAPRFPSDPFGTLDQDFTANLSFDQRGNDLANEACVFTIRTQDRMDDGIQLVVNGTVVLQFNATHWQNQPAFRNGGRFDINNGGLWTPWFNEGTPQLNARSDGTLEFLSRNQSGQLEDVIPYFNTTAGTGNNAYIFNPAPLLSADCRDAGGIDIVVRRNNQGGPGRRPGVNVSASIDLCGDLNADGVPDNQDPCAPAPTIVLDQVSGESSCGQNDGTARIQVIGGLAAQSYEIDLTNITTNESFVATATGSPATITFSNLPAGAYAVDAIDQSGTCTVNQGQFTIAGQLTTPGSIMETPILWLKADAGVQTTQVGARTQVQRWEDQSRIENDAVSDGSIVQLINDENGMNFNPAVAFDPLVDPLGRLGGEAQLDLIVGTNLNLTYFIVPRVTDGDATDCGGDVFNFFDDENLLEIEAFVPRNGCESLTNNFTYGVFNGGEFSFDNIDNRDDGLITFDFRQLANDSTDFRAYSNGSRDAVNQINPYRSPLFAPGRPYSIGQAAINRAAGNRVAPVEVGEVIAFNSVLSETDREIVHSYLAIKYGILLEHDYRNGNGTVIFDLDGVNADYTNNTFGIARNDCSTLDQRQSRSALPSAPLTIGDGTIANTNAANPNRAAQDESYLIVGNNGERPAFLGDRGTANFNNRNFRVYQVSEYIGDAPGDAYQDLDLEFDQNTSAIPRGARANTFALLIDRDGDGDFSNAEEITGATFNADGDLIFQGVDLDHNDLFALARSTCSVEITDVTTTCSDGNNFSISVTIDYEYRANSAATPGRILVTVEGERFRSAPLTAVSGTTTITFEVIGQAAQESLIAQFEGNQTCTDGEFLNLISCDNACVGQPDAISGLAYPDYNLNGRRDIGENGTPAARVNVYDCDGNLVGSAVTGPDGRYNITGLNPGEDYRVEFLPPASSFTTATYGNATSAFQNSDVRFVPAGSCNLDIGAVNFDFCEDENLQYVTACFTRLPPAFNPDADAIVSFAGTGGSNTSDINTYNDPENHPINIGVGQVGPVNGLAFDRPNQRLYMSATIKSETQFPAGGDFADIYVSDNSPNTGGDDQVTTATRLVNLENDCGFELGTYATDVGTPAINDGVDDAVFVRVAKNGIGDIDLDAEGNTLYATNLFNRTLIVLPINEDGSANCGTAREVAIPVPASVAGTGVLRPWAIGRRTGFPEIYVGAVNDASISRSRANLEAFVFRYNPATGAFDPNPVLRFPLNYQRQTNFLNTLRSNWLPWVNQIEDAQARIQFTYCCGPNWFVVHPQPILADIGFDRGDMIIGMMDRFPNQLYQIPPNTQKNFTPGQDFIIPNGDILRAGLNADLSSWTIENGGVTNSVTTGRLESGGSSLRPGMSPYPAPNDQAGPGGREFFWQDDYIFQFSNHFETSLGMLSQVPGKPLALNVWDPARNVPAAFATGGVNFYNRDNGNWERSYLLYGGAGESSAGTFGKGSGFGDLEAVCTPIRVQIGNYVFSDVDEDGVQDPCDDPIANVPVALFAPDGTLRASTTTNARGEYFFSSNRATNENWVIPTDSLDVGQEVIVVFGYDPDAPANSPYSTTTDILSLGADDYVLTLANQEMANGSSERSDSDAELAAAAGQPWDGFPTIRRTIGEEQTNFTYDAGFIPQELDLALTKDFTGTGPFNLGNSVTFEIKVINQGTKPVRRVDVFDTAASGLTFAQAANNNVQVVLARPGVGRSNSEQVSWTRPAATTALLSTRVLGTLGFMPGDTLIIPITYTLSEPNGTDANRFTNTAEISSVIDLQGMDVSDEDIDSQADRDPDNDAGGAVATPSDGAIDGDGTGMPGDLDAATDEDDADVARIPIIDAALVKNVSVASLGPDGMPDFGETLEFVITLTNQGSVNISNPTIFDNIPCAFTAEDATGSLLPQNVNLGWTGTDETGLRNRLAVQVLPGDAVTVSVFATLINPIGGRPGCDGTQDMPYVNSSEIASLEDGAGNILEEDFDSNFDEDDDQEDGGGMIYEVTDGVVGGDGTGVFPSNDPLTDDDDQDVASVDVVDVALRKYQDETQAATQRAFNFGETVKFQIALISQGNVPVDTFDVVDYFPPGLAYNAALNDPLGWTFDATTRFARNTGVPADGLTLGDSVRICIYADVVNVSLNSEDFVNRAEISRFVIDPVPNPNLPGAPVLIEGPRMQDIDSQEDDNPDNDAGGQVLTADDNNIDGLGASGNMDEDDADPAQVFLVQPVTVSGQTFIDVDMDDVRDPTDLSAEGVTVTITLANGDPIPVDIFGDPYNGTTTTGPDGTYTFENLPSGDYKVTFDFSTITNGNPDLFELVDADVGMDDTVDSDVIMMGMTAPTGTIPPGDERTNIDAGVMCVVAVDALGPTATAPVICAGDDLSLAGLDASVTPTSLGGVWTTAGDGVFNGGGNFGSATTYIPGAQDIADGTVVLSLRNNFPAAETGCEAMTDMVTLTINEPVAVEVMGDRVICEDQTADLSAAITGPATTGTFTTDGDGTFSNVMATSATYNPGTADISTGFVILTYETEDPAGPCPMASDTFRLRVQDAAEVDAGPDQTICETMPIQLAGSFGGGAGSANWSGGGGTYTPNAQSPTASYQPSAAEIAAGTVTLTLTTNDPAGPCPAVDDMVTITINDAPTVTTSANQNICEDQTATITATLGGSATGGTWTSSGGGTFADATSPSTTFTPPAVMGASQSYTLTFTTNDADGTGPCMTASNSLVVTVSDAATATAMAGTPAICENETTTVTATVGGGATSGMWTTDGTGSFSTPNDLTATYTPGPVDGADRTVTLTFTTNDPAGPCTAAVATTTVTVSDNTAVTVSADQTICEDETATVTATLSGGATGGTWTSTGGGTFADATDPSTIYTPAAITAADGGSRTETLTFATNDPAGPCGPNSDALQLTINEAAGVTTTTGAAVICENETTTATATLTGSATGGTWTTTGTGSFADATDPTTVYTPGPVVDADGGSRIVTLTFTSNDPTGPCGSATDQTTLTINDEAEVSVAADDVVICENASTDVTATLGGSATSGTWTTTGSGTFTDATNPTTTYTPGPVVATDGGSRTVTLTFTTNDPAGPCGAVSDQTTLTINDEAEVTVSADEAVICEDQTTDVTATLGGSATAGTWTTTGTGSFADATDPTTTYTPGPVTDADGGSRTVTLTFTTADPAGPCDAVSDQTTLTINDQAEVITAITTAAICEDGTTDVTATLGGSATSGTWTTTGTGTFANATDLATTYTPGPVMGADRTVTLTFTTNDPTGPCTAVSDAVTVTVSDLPTVDAGADQTTCEGVDVQLAGSFGGGATSAVWTGGAGTFTPDANDPTATYTPTPAEVAAGTVTLTLTTNDPTGPCTAVDDAVTITINNRPMVDAGADQTVCSDTDADLAATVAFTNGTSNTAGTWTIQTAGTTGTLTQDPDGTATYTPGTTETGAITFRFTADDPDGAGPCPTEFDEVTVTFNNAIVDLTTTTPDAICADQTATLTATVDLMNGTTGSGTWSLTTPAAAGGTLSATTVGNEATYTPGATESGTVSFTFTADDPDGAGPCAGASEVVEVTINPAVTAVDAGMDQVVCSDQTATLTAAVALNTGAAGMGTWSITTAGTNGTLTQTGNSATYTPGAMEIGDITFRFTATDPDGAGPCMTAAFDEITVTFNNTVTSVEAGPDQTLCSDETATLTGLVNFRSGSSNREGTWSVVSGGTPSQLTSTGAGTATYTPLASESGDIVFRFTATDPDGAGPCMTTETDDLTVSFNLAVTSVLAQVSAAVVCSDDDVDLTGTVNLRDGTTTGNGTWSVVTAGTTGTLTSTGAGTATYLPGAMETGDITFRFSANDPDGAGPCETTETDEVTVTFNNTVTGVDAGAMQVVCADQTADLSGTVNLRDGTTSQDGTWSIVTMGTTGTLMMTGTGEASYTPGPTETGDITFRFTADDPDGAGPCETTEFDDVTVTFNNTVTAVDAGADQTICADETATLSATITRRDDDADNTGTWSVIMRMTSGPAGTLTDAGDGTAIYDPASAETGTVSLKFTPADPDGAGPCTTDLMDTVVLTINNTVLVVEAGDDRTVCADDVIGLAATITRVTDDADNSGTWTITSRTTTGSANTLVDNGDGTATYDPESEEAGTITFRFTPDDPDGAGPCTTDLFDEVTITINNTITALTAGPDREVCADTDATLSAEITRAVDDTDNGGTWMVVDRTGTTGSPGTLTDVGDGTATYATGASETGTITFRFTPDDPDGTGPCETTLTEDVVITFTNAVTAVEAGMDQTSCPGDEIALSGMVTLFDGAMSTDGAWSTTGAGTLTDAGDGTATYQPTPTETGTVTFTFTADDPDGASSPCPGGQTDALTLTIRPSPTVSVADQTVCATNDAVFTAMATATAGGTLSYQWQDDRSGTFEDIFNETDATLVVGSAPDELDGRMYRVIVTEGSDGLGCEASATATLTVNPLPECPIDGPTTVGTNQQNVMYSAPAGLASYQWSLATPNGGATIDGPDDQSTLTVDFGTSEVTVLLTVMDANGCMETCQLRTGAAPLELGSTVFEDVNNNGQQDMGELGIPGVIVQLFDATTGNQVQTGPDGTLNTADDQNPAPVVTDADGFYFFDNLFPGDYQVVIPGENFVQGAALATLTVSSNALTTGFIETDPDDNEDGDDDGLQPGGLGTTTSSGVITLALGEEPTNTTGEDAPGNMLDDAADDNGNMTVDFGFFAPIVEVGDFVFIDLNEDGIQSDGEPGLPGVTVTIFNADGTPVTAQSDGTTPYPNTTTTDADGMYIFPSLPPGSYFVEFDLSTGENADLYTYTLTNQGGDDALDSDVTSADGITGQSDNSAFLSSGESDLTLDAGVICNITVAVAEPSATVCSTQLIDLTQGSSLTPLSLGGFWTSSGNGTFFDAAGGELTAPFAFGTAVSYLPGRSDAAAGSVTLTLTTNDPGDRLPPSACPQLSASVTIEVLKVDCGSFFWDGGE